MMKMKMKKAELVFIPAPGIGHLVSPLEVAKRLEDLNSNLSVTFLLLKPPTSNPTTAANFDSLIANATSARIKFIHLPPLEFDHKDGPPGKSMATFIQTQRSHIKDAVNNIVREDSPRLAGFVVDMFFTSLIDLANEFGVPTYVFYTSGAAFLGFQFYMKALRDEQNVNITELKDSDIEFNIPSYINPVSSKLFPSIILKPESSNMMLNMARELREVKGIMVNTFLELESHAVEFLSEGQQLPPVYPLGPILDHESSVEGNQNCGDNDIMEWLHEQPPSSVVFLCFGSLGSFGEDQVKEIAYALEHSGHPFLWSLRRPLDMDSSNKDAMPVGPTGYDNVADVLPVGFLDRTAQIGKIIGWAPQAAILGHQAIGGFVSHCGWNSTLESIWFGVPIATWPLYAEQQLNAFLIVKELGIGVEIKMDYRKYFGKDEDVEIVSAEKIERAIVCLMKQDSNVRKKVKEMSENSRKALMDGGSSHSMLRRFINNVVDNMSS